MTLLDFYYSIKPLIPRHLQIAIRRQIVLRKLEKYKDVWPIDPRAGNPPEGWPGWPEGKKFALVLTHDVETVIGRERVIQLAQLEKELGFKSAFNFVGEDYPVYEQIRRKLTEMGFEVGVHGLTHKGNPFRSREVFEKQRDPINKLLKEWGAVGFRAPSMYHNLDWIGQLDIEYDLSTFDTDPFEPQPDGMGTIFPFWVPATHNQQPTTRNPQLTTCLSRGYVELPYTLPQDHLLFVLLKETSIDIFKKKVDWICEKGGMVLANIHPDYINFQDANASGEEYPCAYYREFLEYVRENYSGQYWQVLPRDLAAFWRTHYGS